MSWNDFIETGPIYKRTARNIKIKQLGIAKAVVVRTRHNGGVK